MNKKFRTPLIYLAILFLVIALIASGQNLSRKQPEKLEFGALTSLIKSGMLDESGAARTEADGSPSPNSKIASVRIEEETLYAAVFCIREHIFEEHPSAALPSL